jgi:hypothetical protein
MTTVQTVQELIDRLHALTPEQKRMPVFIQEEDRGEVAIRDVTECPAWHDAPRRIVLNNL